MSESASNSPTSSGSPPSNKTATANGSGNDRSKSKEEESEKDDSKNDNSSQNDDSKNDNSSQNDAPAKASPSTSNSTSASPANGDNSKKQNSTDEEASPATSPPPPSPKPQSPPPSSPPPPSRQPPPSPSPPPPSTPSKDSSQSSPDSPDASPPSKSSGSSPSPSPPQSSPPPSSATTASPPPSNSTSKPSPPSVNQSPITPTGTFSPPGVLPPPPPSSSKTAPDSSGKSSLQKSPPNNSQKNNDAQDPKSPVPLIVGVVLATILIAALIAVVFYVRKRRKKKRPVPYPNKYMTPPANFQVTTDSYIAMGGHSGGNDSNFYYNSPHQGKQSNYEKSSGGSHRGPDSGILAASNKVFFTYEDLMEITNGFSRQNIIGQGGFGCVYKGWLPDGRVVAVKQLKAGSGQGEREFQAEVEIISRVHHRHLVSLVGYCIDENQRLLIYDFVPNNTLEHHLHSNKLPVLEWSKRVQIAAGAAKGLAYLHEDCHPRIIHRDIKSANILLEDDFEAQVADFGLARLNDTTQTHVSTRVMGTFGYMAPEYASSGKLTDRSDVFSFGVVLLELITGRKPVDPTQPLGDESLVEWARPLLIKALETGDFSELVDPRLEKRFVESQMFRMIEAAAAAVRHSAAKRPRMSVIARALDFEGESTTLSNGMKFGHSTIYDSEKYSLEIDRFRRMALESDNSSEFGMYSGESNSSVSEILPQKEQRP